MHFCSSAQPARVRAGAVCMPPEGLAQRPLAATWPMSPSRGALLLRRQLCHLSTPLARPTASFSALRDSASPLQVYISHSRSPHINLSLEHHLFTTLPASTTTLLFYTNAPCLVIGRNQNPWTESNHPLLVASGCSAPALVRRRSGGGTVYHDLGNVNYSITVPAREFDRDKHAMLMARALRSLGVAGAAVNVRHDVVVLPAGQERDALKLWEETPHGTRKISGSAYKLTRLRSYHHGTMLLSSDLGEVGRWLKSPAAKHIEARGVSSVPSPVANAGVEAEAFVAAAVEEFRALYKEVGEAGIAHVGEEEALEVDGIRKGVQELRSGEWVYGQTPKFQLQIPGVGEVAVDKGVVVGGVLQECVGRRFGGGLIKTSLQKIGEAEKGQWAEEVLGKGVWGEIA